MRSTPLLSGVDVCGLASPSLVRQASGSDGEPTSRALTRLDGYGALVDECGYGPSFDSSTFLVAVGLEPATAASLAAMPGRSTTVRGIGDAARAAEDRGFATVSFVKGSTYVRLRAVRSAGGPSLLKRLTRVSRTLAARVPAEPPPGDAQVRGRCADVDPDLVDALLGAPAALSRSLAYQDQSAACAWATGTTRRARTLTLNLHTNQYFGPFVADQKTFEPFQDIPGPPGDAFTVPGTAYVVAADGQAAVVSGTFAERAGGARKPLPVTPELTALLENAATLLR